MVLSESNVSSRTRLASSTRASVRPTLTTTQKRTSSRSSTARPSPDRRARCADEAQLGRVLESCYAAGRDRRARRVDGALLGRMLEPRRATKRNRRAQSADDDRLEEAVRKDPALADLTNDKGQRAIDLACLECRSAMQKALFFLGRYDVDKGPPEHRSATSLVVRAVDHEAADDYGKLFDEFDKDGSGTLDSNELGALATKLGTNVEILKLEDGQSYTRKAFVAKCQRLFGKERKVVLKIFQVEEQWRNEKRGRDDQQLDARYVVQTIPAPTDDEFAKALGETNLFGEGVGSRAIVMDAANRNLFQIYQSERPDLNKVRMLMQQVMECVQHLHEKRLVHGDIKMLNVVRLSLDNRLRLIDLDAAAKVSRHDGDYVCAKFSSAILPPECFAKLNADQVTKFEAYFEGVDTELREKVAPKTKHGASYVVKTFSLTDDGAPKIDGLPYELVEASVAVDYWSLGALLFQLVAGEPLVPSNRDDDCVNAKSMAILASWNDHAAKKNLAVIKDAAARDLASKLLVRDPDERAEFSIADTLAAHPFFKPPKPGDVATQEKLDKIIEQQEKDSKKLDAILSLSEKHRDELRQTRSTLMRAIYEATEVSTPTAFVVLKERLPAGEASVELTLNDDGTGFVVEGEAVDEAKDRYEESKTWLNLCARFGRGVAKCSPSAIAEAVAGACEELVVGEEMWLYLIDELTGKPVVPEGESIYPIRITKPAEVVSKLLPAMQVGLHAASLVNGVAGVVRLFGYPCPKVPEAWREGAQNSVEVLKQESSVEAFGAVHEKVQDGGEETETVRGAALRELEAFYAKYDPDREYAGLRRIGDPSDGTAVWTLLTDPEEVKAAIEKRAAQRRAEARRHDERFQELMDNAEAGAPAAATTPAMPIAAAGGGPSAARALASPRR
uniref:Calmodulin n=1 Tax=Pelagomonas calceolata TaxID=35677 RepID=A0A7S3ZY23_9STRA